VVDHGGSVSLGERAWRRAIRHPLQLRVAGDGAASGAVAGHRGRSTYSWSTRAPRTFRSSSVSSRRAGGAGLNAATGEAALRLASQSRFDAVVCDAPTHSVAGGGPIGRSCARHPDARTALRAVKPKPFACGDGRRRRPSACPYDVDERARLIEG
jgi:hypothetical protein